MRLQILKPILIILSFILFSFTLKAQAIHDIGHKETVSNNMLTTSINIKGNLNDSSTPSTNPNIQLITEEGFMLQDFPLQADYSLVELVIDRLPKGTYFLVREMSTEKIIIE